MRNALLAASLPLALAACTLIPAAGPQTVGPVEPQSSLAWAAIGQRVTVDGLSVTPLEVLEDSRCPADAQCVWAGQVRIRTMIHLGTGDAERELTSGKPVFLADGSLELVEVRPAKSSAAGLAPEDYRFGLRFMGGL
jgi:hypothetical protein